jgi:hypothetical protein
MVLYLLKMTFWTYMCIDEEEIVDVVNSMHNNKAGGPDGLIIEMFKCSSDITAPLLKSFIQ